MFKTKITKLYIAVSLLMVTVLCPVISFAQEETSSTSEGKNQLIAIAAAIAISLAALGGAIGQGNASASAFQGMSRNPGVQPKIFTSMILGLAFIESLVIYAWIISFLLLAKM